MLQELPLGGIVLRILIGALCVAAAVASYALLGGDFSDTDWKVIATSTLFALTSAMAAAGLSVRERVPVLGARERLVIELTAVADRLERLDAGPQVHAECERLRRLARTAGAQ
jgi:hypothetical protein